MRRAIRTNFEIQRQKWLIGASFFSQVVYCAITLQCISDIGTNER